MRERIECIDDRSLLIADHRHFLEIDTDRRRLLTPRQGARSICSAERAAMRAWVIFRK